MKGHQIIVRSMIADLEHSYGPTAAAPVTIPLAQAYDQLGKLYRKREKTPDPEACDREAGAA